MQHLGERPKLRRFWQNYRMMILAPRQVQLPAREQVSCREPSVPCLLESGYRHQKKEFFDDSVLMDTVDLCAET